MRKKIKINLSIKMALVGFEANKKKIVMEIFLKEIYYFESLERYVRVIYFV